MTSARAHLLFASTALAAVLCAAPVLAQEVYVQSPPPVVIGGGADSNAPAPKAAAQRDAMIFPQQPQVIDPQGWPFNVPRTASSWPWRGEPKAGTLERKTPTPKPVPQELLDLYELSRKGISADAYARRAGEFPELKPSRRGNVVVGTPAQLGIAPTALTAPNLAAPRADTPRVADTTLPPVVTDDLMQSLAAELPAAPSAVVPSAAPSAAPMPSTAGTLGTIERSAVEALIAERAGAVAPLATPRPSQAPQRRLFGGSATTAPASAPTSAPAPIIEPLADAPLAPAIASMGEQIVNSAPANDSLQPLVVPPAPEPVELLAPPPQLAPVMQAGTAADVDLLATPTKPRVLARMGDGSSAADMPAAVPAPAARPLFRRSSVAPAVAPPPPVPSAQEKLQTLPAVPPVAPRGAAAPSAPQTQPLPAPLPVPPAAPTKPEPVAVLPSKVEERGAVADEVPLDSASDMPPADLPNTTAATVPEIAIQQQPKKSWWQRLLGGDDAPPVAGPADSAKPVNPFTLRADEAPRPDAPATVREVSVRELTARPWSPKMSAQKEPAQKEPTMAPATAAPVAPKIEGPAVTAAPVAPVITADVAATTAPVDLLNAQQAPAYLKVAPAAPAAAAPQPVAPMPSPQIPSPPMPSALPPAQQQWQQQQMQQQLQRQAAQPQQQIVVTTPTATSGAALRTPRLDVQAPLPVQNVGLVPQPPIVQTPTTPVGEPATPPAPSGPTAVIEFREASLTLSPAAQQQARALAEQLAANPAARLVLNGYASANMPAEAKRIALNRVLAVRSKLAEFGVQPMRIDVRAVGENDGSGPDDRVDALVR